LAVNSYRCDVAVASGLLIMLTFLFWVAVTPLLLYLVLVALLVVLAEWFKK